MRVTDKHVFFFSGNDIFSNHYRCGNWFTVPKYAQIGAKFWTVEHFMMYEKAMLFRDGETAAKIAQCFHPQEAKKLGRQIKGFDEETWKQYRDTVVTQGIHAKMLANPSIREAAVKFYLEGKIFVEASPYDAIWGIKMGENDPSVDDPANWKGSNLLGFCWEKAIGKVLAGKGVY